MFKVLFFLVYVPIALFSKGQLGLVETTKLEKGEFNPLQEFVGTIAFEQKAILSSQSSGLIEVINFNDGDRVQKGKLLVKIDADILKTQIHAAKANLDIAIIQYDTAKKDLQRYEKLLNSNAIAQKDYDDIFLKVRQAKLNIKVLQAKLDELKETLKKKSIKAVFDGVIIEKNVEIGEWLNTGSKIATLVNDRKISIIFNVPISILNGLELKETYTINISGEDMNVTLDAIIPNGDGLTRTFPIKFIAAIDDRFVFDGQEATIKLSKGSKVGFIIPRDAVIKRFNMDVIFFIDEKNIAQMIPVNILGFEGSKASIHGKGLREGMDVVLKGNERIFPKMPVKIVNR